MITPEKIARTIRTSVLPPDCFEPADEISTVGSKLNVAHLFADMLVQSGELREDERLVFLHQATEEED